MFGIKKLDIFIAKQFGLLFVGTFFICQFVLMMQFLWRYVNDLIGKGLSVEVLAQFFWYMGLMLVPQALPLAILLSSLITFGNLGESSELTAIKAAGISLMRSFRSLIVISVAIMLGSFYFQDVIGPKANMSFAQLLMSMRQKSPELEIPEGIFYDGIPNCNLYVHKKDMKSGMLYGVMIYRMTGSYEDAAIILADSGMMQSTAEKKHLLLTLHSGEWFENMRSQELAGSASVPYRRETFSTKRIVLDFDADFSLANASDLRNNSQGKSVKKIMHDIDSMSQQADSIGAANYAILRRGVLHLIDTISKKDSLKMMKTLATNRINLDTMFNKLDIDVRQQSFTKAATSVGRVKNDLEFKSLLSKDIESNIRMHRIAAIRKFTLALSCLIFFFIGAPLGAIIRKGGLGVPVIISVLVFIVYYIFENTGYRMARMGAWSVPFGTGISTAVLTPVAAFFTYKANKDSVVFNMDAYRTFFQKLFGLRLKRNIARKEVIINDPDYEVDAKVLARLSEETERYAREHKLKHLPSVAKVFFKYEPDHEIERIIDEMEAVIEDLSNTKDRVILSELNHYPVVSVKAHTRPFESRRLNIIAAIIVPVGAFLYLRMCRFRLRLHRDLRVIRQTNERIITRIGEMNKPS